MNLISLGNSGNLKNSWSPWDGGTLAIVIAMVSVLPLVRVLREVATCLMCGEADKVEGKEFAVSILA